MAQNAKAHATLTDQERADLSSRLIAAAQRWRRIGNLMVAQHNMAGHDSLRMSRRFVALASMLRSPAHAATVDAVMVRKMMARPTAEIAWAIIDRLPGQQIPGYREW